MAIQKIFRSTIPSIRYYTAKGIPVVFVGGKFTTDNKKVEEELMQEVGEEGRSKSLHPLIFIDEAEPTLDTEALSPLERLKLKAYEQARADILAEIAAGEARAMDVSANVSSSVSDHAASVATTATITEAVTDSNGAAATPAQNSVAAKLAMLRANANKG